MKCKLVELDIVFYEYDHLTHSYVIQYCVERYYRDDVGISMDIICTDHTSVMYEINCTYDITIDLLYDNDHQLIDDCLSFVLNEVELILDNIDHMILNKNN